MEQRTTIKGVSVSAVIVALTGACSTGPSSYDDCILQYVKAGMDSAAVAAVRRSCRAKFPEGQQASERSGQRLLSQTELGLLTGRAGLSYGSRYSGNLYNGNENLTVTQLEIVVITTLSKERVERTYRADVSIPPKVAVAFGFDILVGDQGADYQWSIHRVLSASLRELT